MAIIRGQLSVKRIAKLTEPGRYPDGDNLYLQVKSSGTRSWIFRYEFRGRERYMGLGPLKNVSPDEARELRNAARKQIREGIDPVTARHSAKAAAEAEAAKAKTFEECAREYFESHTQQWT